MINRQTYIISIVNPVANAGKTTSVINLGAALARHGRRVLLIDFDPLGGMTSKFSITSPKHIGHLLFSIEPWQPLMHHISEHLDVLPAGIELYEIARYKKHLPDSQRTLANALKPIVQSYDYVLIDTPQDGEWLVKNALHASTHFIVPQTVSYYNEPNHEALGLTRLVHDASVIREKTGLVFAGMFLTRHDDAIREHCYLSNSNILLNDPCNNAFYTKIYSCGKIRTAPSQNVVDYAPESRGARDYKSLCQEVIMRCEYPTLALSYTPGLRHCGQKLCSACNSMQRVKRGRISLRPEVNALKHLDSLASEAGISRTQWVENMIAYHYKSNIKLNLW